MRDGNYPRHVVRSSLQVYHSNRGSGRRGYPRRPGFGREYFGENCNNEHECPHCKCTDGQRPLSADSFHQEENEDSTCNDFDDAEEAGDEKRVILTCSDSAEDLGCVCSCQLPFLIRLEDVQYAREVFPVHWAPELLV